MQKNEDIISLFKKYADDLLKNQLKDLKQLNSNTQTGGKLARLTSFNTHLEILKQNLNQKMGAMLRDIKPTMEDNYGAIEKRLHETYAECISSYMAAGFKEN